MAYDAGLKRWRSLSRGSSVYFLPTFSDNAPFNPRSPADIDGEGVTVNFAEMTMRGGVKPSPADGGTGGGDEVSFICESCAEREPTELQGAFFRLQEMKGQCYCKNAWLFFYLDSIHGPTRLFTISDLSV